LLLMVALGVPLGIVAALNRNSWVDSVIGGGTMLAYSIPTFVLIPIGMLVFGVKLRWLPVAGWGKPADMVLPVLVYAAAGWAFFARLTRGAMLEVLSQDYLTTARAKGLRPARVAFLHAFRNAMLPLISAAGPTLALLVTGAFIVESLYNIPGIGFIALQATQMNDYPVVAGLSVLVAISVVMVNLATDLVYQALDPRIGMTG
ncbi:MAG: ABC transporter permease, partial [Chloroflexota bacterium]